MLKLHVFVSHLHIESKFADALEHALTRDFKGQVELFVSSDATSIPVGSQWFEKILSGIERAQLQLVICSSQSVQRPWINYESGAGRIRGIEVVPLCHSGITPAQLPVPLGLSEGVVLTDARGLRRLYAKVAQLLEERLPAVNLRLLADEFSRLQERHRGLLQIDANARERVSDEAIVQNPRVLCVTSKQFLKLGYENQLEFVVRAFPKRLKHQIVTNSEDFERVMEQHTVDIIHIAAYVCPRTGNLYFNNVDLPVGTNRGPLDFISPSTLRVLLGRAKTRLVVIVSGDSLALATDLLSVTNVIAPRDIVSAKAMAQWVTVFYRGLRTRTLRAACEKAAERSHAKMQLLIQASKLTDISFKGARRSGKARLRSKYNRA